MLRNCDFFLFLFHFSLPAAAARVSSHKDEENKLFFYGKSGYERFDVKLGPPFFALYIRGSSSCGTKYEYSSSTWYRCPYE